MPDDPDRCALAKAPALYAMGVGISLSLLAGLRLRGGQERAWKEQLRKRAVDRAEVLRCQVARSMKVVHTVAALRMANISRRTSSIILSEPQIEELP